MLLMLSIIEKNDFTVATFDLDKFQNVKPKLSSWTFYTFSYLWVSYVK